MLSRRKKEGKEKEKKRKLKKKKEKEKRFNVLNRLIETFTVRATHPREKLEVLSRGNSRLSRELGLYPVYYLSQ